MKANYQWTLNIVDTIDWTKDDSGIYCIIYWDVKTSTVRIDFVTDEHEPIISFAGGSDNVRKAVGRWIDSRLSQGTSYRISAEHVAYIGSELEKADTMRIDYVQDGEKTVMSDNPFDVPASVLLRKYAKDNKQKADSITDKYYDVQDIINAECSVEPVKCRHCGTIGETTFNQGLKDAFCASCGRWQLSE